MLVVGVVLSHVFHLNWFMEACTPFPLAQVPSFHQSLPTLFIEGGTMISHRSMMNWGGDGLLCIGELMESAINLQCDSDSLFGLVVVQWISWSSFSYLEHCLIGALKNLERGRELGVF
jgi:hypothetical protein